MDEYGIFSDEGCVERGLYSRTAAGQALSRYDADEREELHVGELCHDHADDEEEADGCQQCAAEDDDEDQDVEDDDQ